jgi:hypothetical protein
LKRLFVSGAYMSRWSRRVNGHTYASRPTYKWPRPEILPMFCPHVASSFCSWGYTRQMVVVQKSVCGFETIKRLGLLLLWSVLQPRSLPIKSDIWTQARLVSSRWTSRDFETNGVLTKVWFHNTFRAVGQWTSCQWETYLDFGSVKFCPWNWYDIFVNCNWVASRWQ